MKTLHVCLVIGLLAGMVTGCGDRLAITSPTSPTPPLPIVRGQLSEVAPPPLLQNLRQSFDRYAPQVAILSPTPDRVFQDTSVEVALKVTDLPVFQADELGLGPHLSLILDNEPARPIYDLGQPIRLDHLSPGTHTLRVFAARPWHESFKNDGAYAQTTFHVITKTGSNAPDPHLPLLTYSRPNGIYGAEPILLDFYLSNAPLHLIAQADELDEIDDWRIRVTVNGESFLLDTWEPIYLQGFQKGENWVKLEFIDGKGNPVENAFNTTARVITYDPASEDALSRLIRGDISATVARQLVDPNYFAEPVIEETPPVPIEEIPAEPIEAENPIEAPDVISEPVEPIRESIEAEIAPVEEKPVKTIELPRLSLPDNLTSPAEPSETPAPKVTLPRLVLPAEQESPETPATASQPPSPAVPEAIPIPEQTVTIEVKPAPPEPPHPQTKNRFFDRMRSTLDRLTPAKNPPADSIELPTLTPDLLTDPDRSASSP